MSRFCSVANRAYCCANDDVCTIIRSCMEDLWRYEINPETVYRHMKNSGVMGVDMFVKNIRLGYFSFCTYQQVYVYKRIVGLLCEMKQEALMSLDNKLPLSDEEKSALRSL